jgi:transketolase
VWSVPFIKPINEEQVASICRKHRVVVVLEEHSVYSGLGGAVAEISSAAAPTWICRVGIQDRFSQYCGTYDYLMHEHKLDTASVISRINQFLSRVGLEDKVVLTNTAEAV